MILLSFIFRHKYEPNINLIDKEMSNILFIRQNFNNEWYMIIVLSSLVLGSFYFYYKFIKENIVYHVLKQLWTLYQLNWQEKDEQSIKTYKFQYRINYENEYVLLNISFIVIFLFSDERKYCFSCFETSMILISIKSTKKWLKLYKNVQISVSN